MQPIRIRAGINHKVQGVFMKTFYDPYGILNLISRAFTEEEAQAPPDLQGLGLCFASLKQALKKIPALFQDLRSKKSKTTAPKDPLNDDSTQ
jgi:hypothetical protein